MLDHEGLEAQACSCYEADKLLFSELMSLKTRHDSSAHSRRSPVSGNGTLAHTPSGSDKVLLGFMVLLQFIGFPRPN